MPFRKLKTPTWPIPGAAVLTVAQPQEVSHGDDAQNSSQSKDDKDSRCHKAIWHKSPFLVLLLLLSTASSGEFAIFIVRK